MIGKFTLPVGYSPLLECRILELPFTERRISLFILLPDEMDTGLMKLEHNMTSDNIKALFSTLKVSENHARVTIFTIVRFTYPAMGVTSVGLLVNGGK